MGDAKRKAKARAEMQEALQAAHAEGQGVWSIESYRCSIIPEVLVRAAAGDVSARDLAKIVTSVVDGIYRPTLGADKPTLCLTCDTAFTPTSRPPETFWVISGYNADARHKITFLMCDACSHKPDVKTRTFEKIKSSMIHDAKEILIGPAGHA